MPIVRPLPPSAFRDTITFGQVWCDFFKRAFVLMAQMRGYKTYEFTEDDPTFPAVTCQYDGKFTVRVEAGETNDVILELLAQDGSVLTAFRVRLPLLYGRNPIRASRLFSQRLTGYLP